MYTRRLKLPERSFLLLGPRGTGKTTWLRSVLPEARWYNLLLDRELFRLLREPGLFRREIDALPEGSWVVVDEVQKLPGLLNEVHDALSSHPQRWRFALTGSSARRLRRAPANLLAGRVISRQMLSLSVAELGLDSAPQPDDLLRYGMLPLVRQEEASDLRVDLLEAYVETYLTQEVRAEALVKSLDSFTRFLQVAALCNAQVTNVAGLARDAGIARPTVQGYFEVLTDTLLGNWLPAWRARARIKETAHPKFYWFDTGVVRALSGRLREPLEAAERGFLLESLVHHELRAHMAYTRCGGELSFYRTSAGTEVDFIWQRGERRVGIEIKASERWRPEFSRPLSYLLESGVIQGAFGVYLGSTDQVDKGCQLLPLATFLSELSAGKVLLAPAGSSTGGGALSS